MMELVDIGNKVCAYSACQKPFRDHRSNVKYCSGTCYRGAKIQRYRTKHGPKTSEYARARKVKLTRLAGGSCKLCGYDKCQQALEFHHLDPSKKRSRLGLAVQPIAIAIEELKHCVLLCANCHREVEAGMSKLVKEGHLKCSGLY